MIATSQYPGRLIRLFDMISTIWTQRHKYGVAQVDVYSGKAFFGTEIVCWFLRRVRRPYILTLHGGNLPKFSHKWSWRFTRLFRSAAKITAPSSYLINSMRRYREDIKLIPNPLNLKSYSFKLRSAAKGNLVWLRAFHDIYNPCLALRVIALLREEFPDIHLIMIGPDKGDGSLPRFRQLAKELKVDHRITIVGPVPKKDISFWLNKGDIFLNTTNVDNTPVSVIEAMACGLCVVSTDVGGIPHLLSDERDAVLVPPEDPVAMAAAVRRILSDPEFSCRLSQNAREKSEDYDWSIILPMWQKTLSDVMEKSFL